MAPEIFSKSGYSISIDYWSLGITCFELLFQDKPFKPQPRDAKKAKSFIFPELIHSSHHKIQLVVSGLLNVEPGERWGAVGHMKELKQSEFFQDINWDLIHEKNHQPVFRPKRSEKRVEETPSIPEIGNGLAYLNEGKKKNLFIEFKVCPC
jgi:serine/threonine kinase 32